MKAKPRELLEKEAKLLEYYNDVVHYLRAFNIDENLLEDAIQDPLSKHYHPSIL